MKRLMAVAGAVLLISSVVAPAGAKGASEATIRGPGLEEPLTFSRYGGSGNDVNLLAEQSGIFPAMFGQSPDPMEDNRPQKTLGLRYIIRYAMPNPAGGADAVVQHIFPYAEGGAVTYTPPGQPFMEGEGVDGERLRTKGGWYQGLSLLKSTLVDAGLPLKAPEVSSSGSRAETPSPSAPNLPVAAIAVLVVVALTGFVLVRRQRWPSARRGEAA
ncbi:MAG: hypothetical protein H0W21_00075 [Actinobacteria bacterium]|nr:hypothetical protein [Actinomycetota bacterium]